MKRRLVPLAVGALALIALPGLQAGAATPSLSIPNQLESAIRGQ